MQEVAPAVQIVIPVHSADRPVRRAVESVLDSPLAAAIVVAHGLDGDLLDLPDDPRVTLVQLSEGVGFPGRAFNEGIRASSAPWVGIMGSDDWYAHGAIDSMLRRATHDKADGVIAPLRHAESRINERNPATWHRKCLRGARDGLYFRTAPLGIFRREVFEDPSHLFLDDVIAGVDQICSALLYSSNTKISNYPSDPAYIVGNDASSRVTTTVQPLVIHGEAWRRLWECPAVLELPRKERLALAEKFASVHLLGMVAARPNQRDWTPEDFVWLSTLAARVKSLEPDVAQSFVQARMKMFDALVEGDLEATLAAQSQVSYLQWRLPAHLSGAFKKNFWIRRSLSAKFSNLRDSIAGGSAGGKRGGLR